MNRLTTSSELHDPPARDAPVATDRVDVHQHLWPPALVAALRARSRAPRLEGWTLKLDGEPDVRIDPRAHDADQRAQENAAAGVDRALVSLSAPLGIELLPGDQADELLHAWREGALALAPRFGAWAAASCREPDATALDRDLDAGFVGLQLPAGALLSAEDHERLEPLLDLLERRSRPLFLHPGPAPQAGRLQPVWWAPVVEYVSQMHAAWYAWRAHGRPRHPRLRVLFAILGGLGPLHAERFAARGEGAGGYGKVDPDAFVEISSYGTRAIDATVRVLGIDQLVDGSDRPYGRQVDPGLGCAARAAIRTTNPQRLLGREVIEGWR